MKNKQNITDAISGLFERAPYFSINALRREANILELEKGTTIH